MKKYSFIGAGNMAYAIIGGMKSGDITVYDKFPSQYAKFGSSVKIAESAEMAVKTADYIVLSVKPQNFAELTEEIRKSGTDLNGKIFISIAAGVSCASICKGLGRDVPVIRTMPNTPLLIGKGVTALSRNSLVSDEAFNEVKEMFMASGSAFELPEDKMNTVIAATSSAPAYIYYIIDCIYNEAKSEGLDSDVLLKMICEMVKGSADMVISSDKTPAELVKMVTSPKGTTEKAMEVFYGEGLSEMISRAMRACTKRAEELSAEL